MGTETTFAIETSGLSRMFGDFDAVKDLDLRVDCGTMYGFLGRNGAGKSTTIKMLTGILKATKGTIVLLGTNVANDEETLRVRRRIGVVPEDLALFDTLTAHEYLTFVARMYRLDDVTLESRIDEILDVLELGADHKQLVLEYSHGMRKKLALAAALLPDPDLLFLDEPFEGVDAVGSRIMRDILDRFVGRGSTVFLTSHVLDIVEGICSHVGIIDAGKLVFQDRMDALNERRLEDVFLELVGSTEEMKSELSWL
ncbi:MAG: ABC transporter ATP-binding protein [Gammaproteobacteria bacterium]|nr:ABC transporter ATP-binding protein [Gammaproteobacteria bacterium]